MKIFCAVCVGILGSQLVACASGQKPDPNAPNPSAPKSERATAQRAVLPAELAAYERARPVFERYCGDCHSADGTRSQASALNHFSMDTYPFGGHHAEEMAGTIRRVLGADGGKATMPPDHPGAVEGDELKLILDWAAASAAPSTASPPGQPLQSCKEMASACHARDKESATAHECHIFFHSSENTEEQCQAKRAECAKACGLDAPSVSHPPSGGSPDAH
ncbi:MAG: hypothetical protein SFV15_19040 [Polyangiaceae bacterium]|nr:hypothetical protein [Polyangiaceae bacterium]